MACWAGIIHSSYGLYKVLDGADSEHMWMKQSEGEGQMFFQLWATSGDIGGESLQDLREESVEGARGLHTISCSFPCMFAL